MSRHLTSDARERLIAEAIKSLKAVEAAFLQIPEDMRTNLLSADPYPEAQIDPQGGVTLTLPVQGNFERTASHHAKLALIQHEQTLFDLFKPAAAGLKALLPARALRWKISNTEPLRHTLYLGTAKLPIGTTSNAFAQGGKPVISTVAGRWRQPLARLSEYFEGARLDEAITRWHLVQSGHDAALSIDARSLEDALLTAGFANIAQESAPAPSSCHKSHALEVVKPHDLADLLRQIDADYTPIAGHVEDRQLLIKQETRHPILALSQAVQRLVCEERMTLKSDLLSEDLSIGIRDYDFVNPADLARAEPSRQAVITAFREVVSRVREQILALHPRLQKGSVHLAWTARDTLAISTPTLKVKLDGATVDCNAAGFSRALRLAAHLSLVTRPGETGLYGVWDQPTVGDWHANVNLRPTYVRATSPDHAALLHVYDKRPNISFANPPKNRTKVSLMLPSLREEMSQAKIRARSALSSVYPQR